jgi:hypothetical protein
MRDCEVAWGKILSSSSGCKFDIRAVQGGHRPGVDLRIVILSGKWMKAEASKESRGA